MANTPILPRIVATRTFKTSDNIAFDDRASAERHELALSLMRKLMDNGFVNDGNLKNMCMHLTKRGETYGPILAAIVRQHKRKG